MTDDIVTRTAGHAQSRRLALLTTATLLHRRLDPRLIASDMAKLVLARSVKRMSKVRITPKQRKRAMITGGIAIAAAIGLRVLYRRGHQKNARPTPDRPLNTE